MFRRVSNFPVGFPELPPPPSRGVASVSFCSRNPPVFSFAGKLDYYGGVLAKTAYFLSSFSSPDPLPPRAERILPVYPFPRPWSRRSSYLAAQSGAQLLKQPILSESCSLPTPPVLAGSFVILTANRSAPC